MIRVLIYFKFSDEENEDAAMNEHREMNKMVQEGPYQEIKKKKRKHRYAQRILKMCSVLIFDTEYFKRVYARILN